MNSLIIINYDLHCGADPHEVKYFTNTFLLKTLLIVLIFVLVVIAEAPINLRKLGSVTFGWQSIEAMLDREVQQK